ncbi:MAG: glycosyltransferase [Planctomycetales bacterium]|nr:glycosyltransferase [Planctomycetales bacterium]NIM10261.1 glycosyltransferase [Planctomycetales bacterium]NIN09699.1 glycosyltransferase [Planctomycetales bacterium]NIN78819.1 glycosyltransferase [Planctomycetales bacterium]NIO35990.1 glycosyltransferase [Planctomycetales bacterium]
MRIAHVITRLILGGAQENTLLCCRDLQHEYGDQVLLITGPARGPEGSLIQEAAQAGIPLHLIDNLRRAIHPWRDGKAYGEIRRTLREFRPDVVHTHSAKGGILGRYAAWSLGVPAIVHTVHGAPFHRYQPAVVRALFRRCESAAARHCHHLISVADAMTDLMVDARVAPREKFTTVYSGMDVEPFLNAWQSRQAVRTELGYAADDIVVGKVARLFHLKGHTDVIQAARKVIPRQPHLQFLLVGDGKLKSAVQRQIHRAGLENHFQITGLVPPARVAELMGAMDMVVHASLREGLARALPQALIAGRPIISYDIDGAREVAIDDVTGYLVPPRDTAALADRICRLADDPLTRQRMGEAGRRRFTDPFRHEHMTARLREIYTQLLQNRGGK